MITYNKKILTACLLCIFFLNSCGIYKKTDAKKIPTNADERIKKNMEEGRGFRLGNIGKNSSGGDFQFASSNPLWRAALKKLSFAPMSNVDYAGGIIVTDWFNGDDSTNEQIKITVRFLSNEIRSDALDIKVFNKKCLAQSNCVISEKSGDLIIELKEKILKTAALYEMQKDKKNSKKYKGKQKY